MGPIVVVFAGTPAEVESSLQEWMDRYRQPHMYRTPEGHYLYTVAPSSVVDGMMTAVLIATVDREGYDAALTATSHAEH